jgi:YVTN family beta-propeller protein
MSRGRRVISSLVLCGLLLAAIPSLASARFAYVTGDNGSSVVVPVNLDTNTPGAAIPIGGGEGAPPRIAITPDGSRAYVPDVGSSVIPIDIATNTAGTPINVGTGPNTVAITPDGTRVYVTNLFDDTVSRIDVATGTVVATIPVGSFPAAIAITPDGSRAYVANQGSNNVTSIDLTTDTAGTAIPVGSGPTAIAITPDGSRAYVANVNGNSVSRIDLTTNTVGATIPGVDGVAIAIAPGGGAAYVPEPSQVSGSAFPINLGADSLGAPIAFGNFLEDVAILPNGATAYVTNSDGGNLGPIDTATNTLSTPFAAVSDAGGIAIVPNQGPRAAFSYPLPRGGAGQAIAFNAAGSTDSDGTVARYDWDFGDGTSVANGGAALRHRYSRAGTYTVTLIVTDNEGCSTAIVFTGQTASCNGSSAARVSHTVTIGCPRVSGSASSFVPRIRSSHVVPGVRVRFATSQPATLGVEATLLWSKEGQRRETALDKLSVRINHWRRIRLPLPAELRDDLPLGSRVRVRLRIEAKPRGRSTCGGRVTHRTLKVRVVEVIPGAVQRGRAG